MRSFPLIILLFIFLIVNNQVHGFSSPSPFNNDKNNKRNRNNNQIKQKLDAPNYSIVQNQQGGIGGIPRRNLILGTVGAVAYGKLISNVLVRIVVNGGRRPEEHESRVKKTFERAITESFKTFHKKDKGRRNFRILEIGIGDDFYTLTKCKAYDDSFSFLLNNNNNDNNYITEEEQKVELYGMDLKEALPNLKKMKQIKQDLHESFYDRVQLNFLEGNICSDVTQQQQQQQQSSFKFISLDDDDSSRAVPLTMLDGYFDVILCNLVLCSVQDQTKALNKIYSLIRPNGGTLGYIEHVAVNDDDHREILEFQQKFFDPVQQKIAHNCHLHRETEQAILEEFGQNGIVVEKERFFVEDMWPVSCQIRGVITKQNLIQA